MPFLACVLVSLLHNNMGLSVIRDCVISLSYSFYVYKLRKALDTCLCCYAQAHSPLYLKRRGITPDRRQSKSLILSTNVDQK